MGSGMRRLGMIALVSLGIVGCAPVTPVFQAEGAPQAAASDAQGARLANDGSSHIWILALDGQRQGVPAHGRYRLAPGRHTVRVQYYWTRGNLAWTGNEVVDCAFDVKPGASLRIACEHAEEPWRTSEPHYKGTWRFWIEDAASREIVLSGETNPIVTREATGEIMEPFFFPMSWD